MAEGTRGMMLILEIKEKVESKSRTISLRLERESNGIVLLAQQGSNYRVLVRMKDGASPSFTSYLPNIKHVFGEERS